MPTILIGQNTKRVNSTKTGMSYVKTLSNCVLKEPCSMHSPVFQVQGLTKGKMYNYAKFENKFYWIDDIIYVTNDIQEIHCHLDPLGTFKTAINNTYAYCVYADGAHWNDVIDDVRFSPEEEAPDQKIEKHKVFQNTSGGVGVELETSPGTVVMTYLEQVPSVIISGNTPVQGWKPGVNTISMPPSALLGILGSLTGQLQANTDSVSTSATWTDYEFWQGINKTLGAMGGNGSWRDNILTIQWLPIKSTVYDNFGYSENVIAIGGVPVEVQGWGVRRISSMQLAAGYYDLTLPWNDATIPASNGHKFLRNSRWCSFNVYACGQLCQFESSQLLNQNTVHVNWCVNLVTGLWNLRICEGTVGYLGSVLGDETLTLARLSGSIGMDLLFLAGNGIGSQEISAKMIGSILPAVGGAIGAAAGGGVGAIAGSQIGNVISAFIPSNINATPTPSGAGGADMTSFLLLDSADHCNRIYIVNKQWKLNSGTAYGWDDPTMPGYCDQYGYPCNKFLQLSTISGYVKCSGASVIGADEMTEADRTTINGYLNTSGVYLE